MDILWSEHFHFVKCTKVLKYLSEKKLENDDFIFEASKLQKMYVDIMKSN